MVLLQDGISVISAGLDHWYKRQDGTRASQEVDITDFRVEEWRLQQRLGVDHFRLPPDFREAKDPVPNKTLYVPCLRFPQWHFCPGCKRLEKLPLPNRARRVPCPECEGKQRRWSLVQVPFVALCDRGHIQDFPWREWVHRSVQPECRQSLRLVATGGSTLSAEKVRCDCGANRSLAQITEANPNRSETVLSKQLDQDGIEYPCQGQRPWLGTEEGEECKRPLRGSLRSASNVYYADVRSAIYLPRGTPEVPSDLMDLLDAPPLSVLRTVLLSSGETMAPPTLRELYPDLLLPFTDMQIESALRLVLSQKGTEFEDRAVASDDEETAFRRAEFEVLRRERLENQLVIETRTIDSYDTELRKYFSRIMLVTKLRETRALAGFTRVFPENEMTLQERRAMLRNTGRREKNWIPAYVVYGEGIFLEFNEISLQEWERRADVMSRMAPMIERYQPLQERRRLRRRPIGPRFVLLHTLAHLIMNRLTFECGYSSASLRERLYVSEDQDAPMAGLLLYTAAGDAEGTMGGLVRMGKPGYLEPVFQQALLEALWCSTDPVCMEMGNSGGQGPDSCNLAACHNCALVPETACEEFNRFLDRGVVVGEPGNRTLGYVDVNEMWQAGTESREQG
jgi:Domain of unknown function (DUF1998)